MAGPQIERLILRKPEYKARVEQLQLGLGTGRSLGNKSQVVGHQLRHSLNNKGQRARGGGRKNDFEEFFQLVKIYTESERLRGHHLEVDDVYREFVDQVEKRLTMFQFKEKYVELSAAEKLRRSQLEERLSKLAGSEKYKQSFTFRLLSYCSLSLHRPQRFTVLSTGEEKVRCHLTWQMGNRLQYFVAFGDVTELERHVVKAAEFAEQRSETAIVMADHIPIWLRLGERKALFASWERFTNLYKIARKGDARYKRTSQKLTTLTELEEKARLASKDQTQQARGRTSADEAKVRVTLEARQAILDWWGVKDPTGVILPSVLTVHGAHARLANIGPDHRWIREEKFYLAGKLVVHKPGQHTPSLCYFVELRSTFPALFVDLVVFSQPSAVHDEIIHCWDIEDIRSRFPQALNLRDLLHVGFTQKSKAATRLGQQVNSWIAAGMTPVLQWTDTDGAFTAKRAAEHCKQKIITEVKEDAELKGQPADFKIGTYELLRIANAAHQGMVEKNLTQDSVLAGMRRNGFLSWRPDLEKGQFVRADEQDWCKNADGTVKFPEGSHRMKDDWLVENYNFLSPEGKPVLEDWSCASASSKVNEMMEPEYMKEFEDIIISDKFTKDHEVVIAGKKLTVPVLDLDAAQDALFDAELLSGVLKTPKQRRLELRDSFNKELQEIELKRSAGKKDCGKDAKVKVKRTAKIDCALKDLDKDWHEGMEEDLKEKTVEEIFALLLPGGGNEGQRKVRKMTTSKLKKDCNELVSLVRFLTIFLQLCKVAL